MADDRFKDLDEYEDSETMSDDESEEAEQPKEMPEKHRHDAGHEKHPHKVSHEKHPHHVHRETHEHHTHHESHVKKDHTAFWLIMAGVCTIAVVCAIFAYAIFSSGKGAEKDMSKYIQEIEDIQVSAEKELNSIQESVNTLNMSAPNASTPTITASDLDDLRNQIAELKSLINSNNRDMNRIQEKLGTLSDNLRETGQMINNQRIVGISDQLSDVAENIETATEEGPSSTIGETVSLDFYVMSQCPYGVQVEDGVKPALDKLGDRVDFSLNFIAKDNGDGTFSSLHGQKEVEGNIVQLCAAKYNPDRYMDLVVCMNENYAGIPGNWELCAKDAGLAVDSIRTCFSGAEGKSLLSASIDAADAANAQASPTMFLNGAKYTGGRGENDFLRSLCNAFTGDKPLACSSIPEPTTVNVVLLTDKRCAECDTTELQANLLGVFPGMVAQKMDYGDAAGKKLYEDLKLTALPAVLFDETVSKDENYAKVAQWLVPTGTYQSLRIGATFDPTAEICDNEIDDDDNGDIDCDDDSCDGAMVCREEKKKNLQVFVMSDCPYGKLAIMALNEVVENFNNQITFEVHYIASETEDGFSSLHGQYEVDENIVQLCVKKHSPAVWLDYLVCRSDTGIKGIDWTGCANKTGVAVSKVTTCSGGTEGKDLLANDIKIANSLDFGASPTWLANNKYQFSGIYAEPVKASFCQYNTGLAGCENTLTGAPTGSQPSGNCG